LNQQRASRRCEFAARLTHACLLEWSAHPLLHTNARKAYMCPQPIWEVQLGPAASGVRPLERVLRIFLVEVTPCEIR